MANIKFRLNNGAKTIISNDYSIYLRYKFGREVDLKKAIGFKVFPDQWNTTAQKVKNRSEIINRNKINTLLQNLTRHFEDFEDTLKSKGQKPTKSKAINHYENFFKKSETKNKPQNLLEYIKEFRERPDILKTRTEGTIKNYKLTEKFLTRFNDEVYPIDFSNIDMDFYNDFVEWSENQNLTKNYIGKHINTLKTFMNNATYDKVNKNLEFKNPRFKVLKEEAENIYLNLEELDKIFKLNLTHLPKQDQARDLFLIGAYTGLRVSDFNNLNENNIFTNNGILFLRIKPKKDIKDKEVIIPLRPEVKAIFKKHNNKPPKTMPDQHINYKIKDVCESAGIDETVYKEQTRSGEKVKIKKLKFEMVKTHTARRSFCTNAYLSGMPAIDIMQISGHSSEKTFLNYIKADALQKAVKISAHPFFNGKNN
jgi:integrase|tara:strand:+ start:1077 stop:2348 length:1272 start_codon:yes stop_codon:yes gene_type:complete